jgi:hypothetical protein
VDRETWRPTGIRVGDVVGWGVLGVLSAMAVYLGSLWLAGSWLQPTVVAAVAVALLVGLLVGDRRAVRAGLPRRQEAVRYGLLFAMLVASTVGLTLLAVTWLFSLLLGGWVS